MKGLLRAASALACVACAAPAKQPTPRLNRWGRPYKDGMAAPAWVDELPEAMSGKLRAVGYSPPSFWPQDAIDAAADEARGKLALAVTSHVEVLGMDAQDARGASGATIEKEATEVVLRNSRIEATWVDESGERSERGGVWALASIELDSIRGARASTPPQAATLPSGGAGPAWLDRLPRGDARVYAVGYSGPTFDKPLALRYAGDDAVEKLAASLRARVQAYTLLVENASGLTIDQFAQTADPDASFLGIVRKNAKMEATWVDVDGARPGDPPGAVWALASIEVHSTHGAVNPVDNPDLAPALDPKGNASPR
jgi:hypothetical protein